MKASASLLVAVFTCFGVCQAYGEPGEYLDPLSSLNWATESKIQVQVLDSLLGRGKAFAFLEMKAEVKANSEEEGKSGEGELISEGEASEAKTEKEGKEKKQKQSARQIKKSAEEKTVLRLELRAMKLRLLHDASLSPEALKAVKETLLALYPEKLKSEDIAFVPAVFAPGKTGSDR